MHWGRHRVHIWAVVTGCRTYWYSHHYTQIVLHLWRMHFGALLLIYSILDIQTILSRPPPKPYSELETSKLDSTISRVIRIHFTTQSLRVVYCSSCLNIKRMLLWKAQCHLHQPNSETRDQRPKRDNHYVHLFEINNVMKWSLRSCDETATLREYIIYSTLSVVSIHPSASPHFKQRYQFSTISKLSLPYAYISFTQRSLTTLIITNNNVFNTTLHSVLYSIALHFHKSLLQPRASCASLPRPGIQLTNLVR